MEGGIIGTNEVDNESGDPRLNKELLVAGGVFSVVEEERSELGTTGEEGVASVEALLVVEAGATVAEEVEVAASLTSSRSRS